MNRKLILSLILCIIMTSCVFSYNYAYHVKIDSILNGPDCLKIEENSLRELVEIENNCNDNFSFYSDGELNSYILLINRTRLRNNVTYYWNLEDVNNMRYLGDYSIDIRYLPGDVFVDTYIIDYLEDGTILRNWSFKIYNYANDSDVIVNGYIYKNGTNTPVFYHNRNQNFPFILSVFVLFLFGLPLFFALISLSILKLLGTKIKSIVFIILIFVLLFLAFLPLIAYYVPHIYEESISDSIDERYVDPAFCIEDSDCEVMLGDCAKRYYKNKHVSYASVDLFGEYLYSDDGSNEIYSPPCINGSNKNYTDFQLKRYAVCSNNVCTGKVNLTKTAQIICESVWDSCVKYNYSDDCYDFENLIDNELINYKYGSYSSHYDVVRDTFSYDLNCLDYLSDEMLSEFEEHKSKILNFSVVRRPTKCESFENGSYVNKIWVEDDPLNEGSLVLYVDVRKPDGEKPDQSINPKVTITGNYYFGDEVDRSWNVLIGFNSQNSTYLFEHHYGIGVGEGYVEDFNLTMNYNNICTNFYRDIFYFQT